MISSLDIDFKALTMLSVKFNEVRLNQWTEEEWGRILQVAAKIIQQQMRRFIEKSKSTAQLRDSVKRTIERISSVVSNRNAIAPISLYKLRRDLSSLQKFPSHSLWGNESFPSGNEKHLHSTDQFTWNRMEHTKVSDSQGGTEFDEVDNDVAFRKISRKILETCDRLNARLESTSDSFFEKNSALRSSSSQKSRRLRTLVRNWRERSVDMKDDDFQDLRAQTAGALLASNSSSSSPFLLHPNSRSEVELVDFVGIKQLNGFDFEVPEDIGVILLDSKLTEEVKEQPLESAAANNQQGDLFATSASVIQKSVRRFLRRRKSQQQQLFELEPIAALGITLLAVENTAADEETVVAVEEGLFNGGLLENSVTEGSVTFDTPSTSASFLNNVPSLIRNEFASPSEPVFIDFDDMKSAFDAKNADSASDDDYLYELLSDDGLGDSMDSCSPLPLDRHVLATRIQTQFRGFVARKRLAERRRRRHWAAEAINRQFRRCLAARSADRRREELLVEQVLHSCLERRELQIIETKIANKMKSKKGKKKKS